MGRPLVGISLHADLEFLEHVRKVVERRAEILEVTPETLWRATPDGGIRENDYHAIFADIRRQRAVPFIAHGVEWSPGTAEDAAGGGVARRTRQWLEQVRRDHATFDFLWYTEHLGFNAAGDLHAALPLPLPFATEAAAATRARLELLRSVVPVVGFENSVNYAFLGGWHALDLEPAFLTAVAGNDLHLLLDLHNVYTECRNEGRDPFAWVEALALDRVIEIHLSGGSESEAGWVRGGRVFRLDGHDGPVPDEVWALFEHVLPRCPRLRAVIVERMTGTLDAASARAYADELERAREVVERAFPRSGRRAGGTAAAVRGATARAASSGRCALPALPPGCRLADVQRALLALVSTLRAREEVDTLVRARPELEPLLGPLDRDALQLTALLVRKLRFERLLQGSREAAFWFETRPEEFAKVFGRYCRDVAPTAVFPVEEVALFEEWAVEAPLSDDDVRLV
jgi:uncharacterized protein (UPF0276 family)